MNKNVYVVCWRQYHMNGFSSFRSLKKAEKEYNRCLGCDDIAEVVLTEMKKTYFRNPK